MGITENQVTQEIKNICQYIMKYCVTESGIAAYHVDIDTNKCSSKIIGGDIGDFVPFIYWAGELLEDENIKNWACYQTDLYIDLLQKPSGIFVSSVKSSPLQVDLVDYRDLSDLIVGLDLMYLLTGKVKYLESLVKFYDYLEKDKLIVNKKLPYFFYLPLFKMGLPISFGQAAGIFIEEAVQLASYKGDEKYLALAKNLFEPWATCDEFEKNGLFPFLIPKKGYKHLIDLLLRYKTGLNINQAVIFKQNTNICFGIINLLKKTKDKNAEQVIVKWCDSVINLLQDDKGFFYAVYNLKNKNRENIILNYNNAIMDVFLDLQLECGIDSYVNVAAKCADFWLARQTSDGLITQGIEGQYKFYSQNITIPYYWVELDSQVDLAIVLMKIYEITGNKVYKESIHTILAGIIKIFKYKETHADFVNSKNGQACRKQVEVKFLSLYLKFLIAYVEMIKGKKIMDDEKIRSLIRDR